MSEERRGVFHYEYPLVYAVNPRGERSGYLAQESEDKSKRVFFIFQEQEQAELIAKWFGFAAPEFKNIESDKAFYDLTYLIEKLGFTEIDLNHDKDSRSHIRASIAGVRDNLKRRMRLL